MTVVHEIRYKNAITRNVNNVLKVLPKKYFDIPIAKIKTMLGIRAIDSSMDGAIGTLQEKLNKKFANKKKAKVKKEKSEDPEKGTVEKVEKKKPASKGTFRSKYQEKQSKKIKE